MSEIYENGYDELEQLIKSYADKASDDDVQAVLEIGANETVDVLLRLPKPRSMICKTGYTHLVDSFAFRNKKDQVEVGWGKYYGPIVEKRKAHLMPAWKTNKKRIYQRMVDSFYK